MAKEKKLHYAFVDLVKAFDRVPRKVTRWALKKAGILQVAANGCSYRRRSGVKDIIQLLQLLPVHRRCTNDPRNKQNSAVQRNSLDIKNGGNIDYGVCHRVLSVKVYLLGLNEVGRADNWKCSEEKQVEVVWSRGEEREIGLGEEIYLHIIIYGGGGARPRGKPRMTSCKRLEMI